MHLAVQREHANVPQLITDFHLTCHEKTVRNALHNLTFSCEIIKFVIFLTKDKRKQRYEFVKFHIFRMTIWAQYIFSDEKEWCLKDPTVSSGLVRVKPAQKWP